MLQREKTCHLKAPLFFTDVYVTYSAVQALVIGEQFHVSLFLSKQRIRFIIHYLYKVHLLEEIETIACKEE